MKTTLTPPITPTAPDRRIFEICLDHEPTSQDIYSLQSESGTWQNLKVIKLYLSNINVEKRNGGKFWTLSFEVHQDDWLFWCGFCCGKRWGVNVINMDTKKKRRLQDIGQWLVQI